MAMIIMYDNGRIDVQPKDGGAFVPESNRPCYWHECFITIPDSYQSCTDK